MNLSENQQDTLKELVNIGVGQAAAILNEMLQAHIELEAPCILVVDLAAPFADAPGLTEHELACVQLDFAGSFSGTAALVFPTESAITLVSMLTNEPPGTAGLDAVMAGTLNEVGNIVINGVIGAISNILSDQLDFALPTYLEGRIEELLKSLAPGSRQTILLIKTSFRVAELQLDGNIFLLFEVGSFDQLLAALDRLSQPAGTP